MGGYTLIETMIALSIFLIVITIGVGSLLNVYNINRKSQDMRSVMDSLSFSMEDMSRNIRTGYNYQCIDRNDTMDTLGIPKSCLDSFGIAFESSTGNPKDNTDQWVYYIEEERLFKSATGINKRQAIQMTPDEVHIGNHIGNFSVIGADPNDSQQPLVVIRLAGTITSRGVETPFSLQTAVSQRLSDINNV